MVTAGELKSTNIEISVPWGHIAGKVWGNSSDRPILAIHGVVDNCGVFDRLISLLRGNYYVVAIDLPGHGLSSHFPAGVPVEFLNFVLAIFYVVKEINLKRFLYMGHSLGGQVGLFFTAIFPEYVEKLIVIDNISPPIFPDDNLVQSTRNILEQHIELQTRLQNGTPPIYTFEEALEKCSHRETATHLTEEAAKIVLKRSLKEVENGVSFRMDQRSKQYYYPLITKHLVRDVVQHVECPTLFIFSTERYKHFEEAYADIFPYLRKKPNITIEVVTGDHDIHQNHPERIVKFVDQFAMSQESKL